jgi:hypothetical protein
MPTNDRKDKFARQQAVIRRRYKYVPFYLEVDENISVAYNNFDYTLCDDKLYKNKDIYLYKSDYKRFVKKYVNKYVRLKENGKNNNNDSYGIILSYEDSEYSFDIIDDDSFSLLEEPVSVNDKKCMNCNIFDIFNPKIEYDKIPLYELNKYLLSKSETRKIDKFIKEYYNKNKLDNTSIKQYDTDTCVICLDDYTSNTTKYTTQCGHIFHKDCFNKWDSIYCPLCNQLSSSKSFNIIYQKYIMENNGK